MNTAKELLADLRGEFSTRKFSAGLLLAMVDFVDHFSRGGSSWESLEGFLEDHPRLAKTQAGQHANTMIVNAGDHTVGLRPFYNSAEKLFRVDHKRFDYPSCAPHATQAWGDYTRWMDQLFEMEVSDRVELRKLIIDFVLDELPSHEFDPSSVLLQARLFEQILQAFDLSKQEGGKTGSAFQGVAFGFLRADNPHLQVEIEKVRTGSKRLQRVGDIDCWDGIRLAITAEVKHYEIGESNMEDLAVFAGEGRKRTAIVIVVATGFSDVAREYLEGEGVNCIDLEWLISAVRLWDPAKQQIAVSSLVYYVKHVEKNEPLRARLQEFLHAAQPEPAH